LFSILPNLLESVATKSSVLRLKQDSALSNPPVWGSSKLARRVWERQPVRAALNFGRQAKNDFDEAGP